MANKEAKRAKAKRLMRKYSRNVVNRGLSESNISVSHRSDSQEILKITKVGGL